jgi:RNA recognition motif-containing protein
MASPAPEAAAAAPVAPVVAAPAAAAAAASNPPNETIYVHNLNEKVKKAVLKKSLHSVFSQFGKIVDIVALRGFKLRGQAWVVFENKAAATNALRQMQNFPFYDKPLIIEFAKTQSDVISKKAGTFKPREKRKREEPVKGAAAKPAAAVAAPAAAPQAAAAMDVVGAAQPPPVQPPLVQPPRHQPPVAAAPAVQNPPNSILFATALPAECTQSMLSMLFQQYRGFREVRMVPGKAGIAFIEFDDEMVATLALQGLTGFKLTPTDTLQLSYAKR